jgi:uncharacterized protein
MTDIRFAPSTGGPPRLAEPAPTTARPQVTAAQPMLGIGEVRHRRLRPASHAFAYPTYFLMLPMRALRHGPSAILRRNRWGLLAFHDRDHGDGGDDALAWIEQVLTSEGVTDAQGEIWLHTYPRVLGYVFKPVSFWYCHRADQSLAAVVVEVNNTFGERHCYVLSGPDLAWGREQRAHKVFHVSPFCEVQGLYRFRFLRHGDRTLARIDHDDDEGPVLQTSVSGRLAPLSRSRLRAAFFGMPLMTLGVIVRIHWQALQLWLKRVPWVSKPAPPTLPITQGHSH